MVSNKGRNTVILALSAAVGICLPNILETTIGLDSLLPSSSLRGFSRRSLAASYESSGGLTLWAHHFIVGNHEAPNPTAETALFWHVPKAGGTTVKSLYECMGHTLANRVGGMEQFGHDKDTEIIVFEPHQGSDLTTVNVDVTSKEGILRAKAMGLAASRKTDLIVTTEPSFAGEHLFDEVNRGRMLGLFRHPVDRAISKFYYLQTATWERTYRPEWKGMPVEEWAAMKKGNNDENFMVRKLTDKSFREPLDENDLNFAKELLRQRFIVGLMTEMEESVRRFNIYLGVDPWTDARAARCMQDMFAPKDKSTGSGKDPKNSNKHPKVLKGSKAYNILARRNDLDVQLFDYIVQLFDEQTAVINSFAAGNTQALDPAPPQIAASPVEVPAVVPQPQQEAPLAPLAQQDVNFIPQPQEAQYQSAVPQSQQEELTQFQAHPQEQQEASLAERYQALLEQQKELLALQQQELAEPPPPPPQEQAFVEQQKDYLALQQPPQQQQLAEPLPQEQVVPPPFEQVNDARYTLENIATAVGAPPAIQVVETPKLPMVEGVLSNVKFEDVRDNQALLEHLKSEPNIVHCIGCTLSINVIQP